MGSEARCIVGLPSFIQVLWPRLSFSLVQLPSHLTLRLYAKRSAHPDILIGNHEMRIPLASQSGSFCRYSLWLDQFHISRADIACVLKNDVGEAVPSAQPVTVYITINITPTNPYNNPPSIQTKEDGPPAKEATIPECTQAPAPERRSPLLVQQTVGTDNTTPQSREEVSPDTKNSRLALQKADQVMTRIIPVDRSTWQKTVGRIKWVMDTLGPLAAVRTIFSCCP